MFSVSFPGCWCTSPVCAVWSSDLPPVTTPFWVATLMSLAFTPGRLCVKNVQADGKHGVRVKPMLDSDGLTQEAQPVIGGSL